MRSALNLSARSIRSTTSRGFYLAAAFFICNSTGAFSIIDRLKYGEWAGRSGGDPLTQFLNLMQIAVSITLFWLGYQRSRKLVPGATLLLILVGFLIVSVAWSVDPQTTMRRGILYLFFMLGVIGISNGLSGEEYMGLVKRIVFWSVIASIVLLPIPSANILMIDGTLRGIYSHKNVFGQILAAGVIAGLYGVRVSDRRWTNVAVVATFVGLGFFVKSGTALLTMFTFCGAETVAVLYRRGGALRAVTLMVAIPLALVLFLFPDLMLGLLGKDATLTGRTELWVYVDAFIAQKPLLGWGFGAFWSPTNALAVEVSNALGWVVPEAHNGLRELLLEVGIVGTALFAIVFLRNIRMAVRSLRTPSWNFGLSLLLCGGGILLVAMTEEVFVDFSQVAVGMFFVMGLICERTLRVAALPQRIPAISPSAENAISFDRARFGAAGRLRLRSGAEE